MSLFVASVALGEVQLSLFVAGAALGDVQVLLFVADAALGEVQVSLFVAGAALCEKFKCHFSWQVQHLAAGAALGEVQVSLIVAGAALGECLNESLGAKRSWRAPFVTSVAISQLVNWSVSQSGRKSISQVSQLLNQ